MSDAGRGAVKVAISLPRAVFGMPVKEQGHKLVDRATSGVTGRGSKDVPDRVECVRDQGGLSVRLGAYRSDGWSVSHRGERVHVRISHGARASQSRSAATQSMFGTWQGLSFTSQYAGVVISRAKPKSAAFEAVVDGVQIWFFEHDKGSLWIATAGQHPETLMKWLHGAHEHFACTSMLAAILENGSAAPPLAPYSFTIQRSKMRAGIRDELARHFTIYLPNTDEFIVLAEPDAGLALERSLRGFKRMATARRLLYGRHRGIAKPPTAPSGIRYDPIKARLREVIGPASQTASEAAAELVRDWSEVLGEPVPDPILRLQGRIEHERERIWRAIEPQFETRLSDPELSDVEEYATKLRGVRREVFDLRSRIRESEWPRRARATYDSIATPFMLLALRRYATDVAMQLDLGDRVFLPVIGENFSTTSRLFTGLREQSLDDRSSVTVIEVPAETRMRLGALPMVAAEIASSEEDRVSIVANGLMEEERNREPAIREIFKPLKFSTGRWSEREMLQGQSVIERQARDYATHLLAAAVAGPPFVSALARFSPGGLEKAEREMFYRRIAVCLGFLSAVGARAEFNSVYMPFEPVRLPRRIVSLVEAETPHAERLSDEALKPIIADLAGGRVVPARPTAVLAALWTAVSTGGPYVHEIAATVSVAHWNPPGENRLGRMK